MSRQKQVLPSYLLHKPTGQARVRIAGKDYYLGPYGSEESRIAYGELLARTGSGQPPDPFNSGSTTTLGTTADSGLTVAELLLAFSRHAEKYYGSTDGKKADEVDCFNSAMRPVRELYDVSDKSPCRTDAFVRSSMSWRISLERTKASVLPFRSIATFVGNVLYAFLPASAFGPLHLKAVREKYLAAGWTRGFCNKSTNRIRHIWRWGVSNGMTPVGTLQALVTVEPLKAGRCAAAEGRPRQAVDEKPIAEVRKQLRQLNRDILDLPLLLLIGSRPGELLSVTWNMIDTSKPVWVAVLVERKNKHRGKTRKTVLRPEGASDPQEVRAHPT